MSTLQRHEPRVTGFLCGAVDVPPPAPDIVPTQPTPHPMPPGAPPEMPPLEHSPEISEPPMPDEHWPMNDPIAPGYTMFWPSARFPSARFPSARWRWPWH